MGGLGSGRPGWRTRVEEMLALDFRRLKKDGFLLPGKVTNLLLKSPYRVAAVHMEAQEGALLVRVCCKPPIAPGWDSREFRIPLATMGTNRLCALCPKCGRAYQILYSGGTHFRCKRCHELAYSSQFVGAEERARKRAQ